ncbi:MAG: 30S ribosomal protein S17 [Proteobacteria bacterium]|nr:30S ribosomal protein S17 [Pseudomonadota bacterium]
MPKRRLSGTVIKKSGSKTISVLVNSIKKDKRYGKFVTRHKKYAVHDPEEKHVIGDIVEIIESIPISKTKKWCVA